MTSDQIKQLDANYIAQTYAKFDLALSHGQGCEVWDFDGNKYLDFTSGIGVNSLGWADPDWLEAVIAQLHKLSHTSNLFYTEPSARLAKHLVQVSGLKRVFLLILVQKRMRVRLKLRVNIATTNMVIHVLLLLA